MLFTSLFTVFSIFFLAIGAQGVAIRRAALDVFVPTILQPCGNTTWTMGKVETVSWDTSDAPEHISNGASVVLNGVGVLAKGFSLRDGKVNVTVPHVNPGKYTITLFGDSGDVSPEFDIVSYEDDE
ncbi:hypothetical protein BDZ94DRAFT_377838 [Collybia nuda]|uniref:Uncharacterized protein n=1 Tax=Collybia nuda TaxID=64659 RepID=A0A9P5YI70_9AGAR|nr:hypothetical protein BDZ94DRAFT_377838 [Collybia nuda]